MERNADSDEASHLEVAASVQQMLANADRLEAQREYASALAHLTDGNRRESCVELERRMVALRRTAFAESPRSCEPPLRGDPSRAVPVAPSFGLPRVTREQLDARVLGDTIAAHGVLVCTGLLSPGHVQIMRDTIDRAFEARRAIEVGALERSPWFELVRDINPFGRAFMGPTGMYICDSPRGLFRYLEVLRETGVMDLLRARLGGEIAMMPDKCVMRRVEPLPDEAWTAPTRFLGDSERFATWHQDAEIIDAVDAGPSVIDVWIALSHCGQDAPGLEVVPANLQRLLPTAGGAPMGPILDATIDVDLPGTRSVLPALSPGDVVFIDQFTVHGTSYRRHMRESRYSVEGWFFTSSTYPSERPGFLV